MKNRERVFQTCFWFVFSIFGSALVLIGQKRHLETWDESRNLNNSIEMALKGHWLVPMYDWKPDHWNTKPPLLIWIQAALMRLHLQPVWALRLPSEIASLATVALLVWFGRVELSRSLAGILSGLLLMCSTVFFGVHLAIGGDYDALLSLFTTIYCLSFWKYLEDSDGKALWIAGTALSLSILTKSVAGLLLLPGLSLFVLAEGKLVPTLRDKRLWLACAASLGAVALYYVVRNWSDPGYLHDVWLNEWGGRFSHVNEGNSATWNLYFVTLFRRFEPGCLLVLLTAVTFLRSGKRTRSVVLMCLITSSTFLLILTKSATKFWYYCAPCIPLLSIAAGIGLEETLRLIKTHWPKGRTGAYVEVASFSLLMLGTCMPLILIQRGSFVDAPVAVNTVDRVSEIQKYHQALEYLANFHEPVNILDTGTQNRAGFKNYNPVALFYATEAESRGQEVHLTDSENYDPRGDAILLSCDSHLIRLLGESHPPKAFTHLPNGCVYLK